MIAGGRFPKDAVRFIPVHETGVVDLAALKAMLNQATREGRNALVSLMFANNETGAIQPVHEAAHLAHEHGALLHTDAVQAAGRIAIDIAQLGVDRPDTVGAQAWRPAGRGRDRAGKRRPELRRRW